MLFVKWYNIVSEIIENENIKNPLRHWLEY